MNRIHLLIPACLFFSYLSAQELEEEILRPHEFILAFGTASSTENSVFNVPGGDVQASPDFSYYLGYYYTLSDRLAVGSHLFGYSQTINNVPVVDASSTLKFLSFDLAPYGIGLQARYLLMTGSVQPYVTVMANVALGTLSNNDYGTMTMFGFSAGGTAGVRVFLFDAVTFSVQGYATFGSASFKSKPFQNSDSDDFDPSMAGVIFGLAYHWGD